MVKKGYIQCETCKRSFKNKQAIASHKCIKKAPLVSLKCMVCGATVLNDHFNRHVERCEAKQFFLKHRSFFQFFIGLIKRYNSSLRRRERRTRRNEALDEVTALTLGHPEIDDKLYKELVRTQIEEMRKKANIEAFKEARKVGIAFKKGIPLEVIKDAIKGLTPRISGRQIIYDYLGDKKMFNESIRHRIDKRFGNKDYPTNKEILPDIKLFNVLNQTRANTGYKDVAEKYYYMCVRYFHDPYSYQCKFCEKMILKPRIHIKVCSSFKHAFEDNKREAIKDFMTLFYKDKLKDDMAYWQDWFEQFSLNFLFGTVDEHIKDKVKYQKKIEEGRRKFHEEQRTPFNAKDWVKEISSEVPHISDSEDSEIEAEIEIKDDDNSIHGDKKEDIKDNKSDRVLIPKSPVRETLEPQYASLTTTMNILFKARPKPLPKDYKSDDEDEESIDLLALDQL